MPQAEPTLRTVLESLSSRVDPDVRARRGSARRPVGLRVVVWGREVGKGWALNLSRGGIRIVTDDLQLAVGEPVHLRILKTGAHLLATGTVVWVDEFPDGSIAGIAFTSLHVGWLWPTR